MYKIYIITVSRREPLSNKRHYKIIYHITIMVTRITSQTSNLEIFRSLVAIGTEMKYIYIRTLYLKEFGLVWVFAIGINVYLVYF